MAMPTGPEQLRTRLAVMANTLIMMRMKHAARVELKDITPAFIEKYKDYLLGDYVYGLRASDDYGGIIPPWTLVLSYEHAIRKHCYCQGAALHNAPSPLCQARIRSYCDGYARPWQQGQQGQGQGQGQGQEGAC